MAKNRCSSVAIACLAALPGVALAGNFATGTSGSSDRLVTDNSNWTTLRTVSIAISSSDTAVHGCVVNASADVSFEVADEGVRNRYIFTVTRNDINPLTDSGFERTLFFVDNPNVRDTGIKPVATTGQFTGLTRSNGLNGTGTHTFRLLGRRLTAEPSTIAVTDSSLTVVCLHTP
ncbi:hypothetical protein [Azohydromonas caseinilytica]|uniref:Secreted protein n=1 Tax=Azohydromonas caseinilytica TaxID=2728836 RepID=A0A848F8M6_9BURK|nr:hypothetical protein [Azohydromonas caseinilytica]NML14693.1 hypothetical protein [Azohydromonas caseinilytica]